MQQDKYIFHLYVFSTCFGLDITHHQELQNCTHSDMVMVPREVRRNVVEEIKWRLARQYYARVGDVKSVERSLVSRCNRNCEWWVISRPKYVENTYKWNIYLSCCIKLVFSIIRETGFVIVCSNAPTFSLCLPKSNPSRVALPSLYRTSCRQVHNCRVHNVCRWCRVV